MSNSDAALVMRLRSGEEAAVELLLSRYQAPLLSYAFRLLRDREAAEDVVQESLLKFLDHLSELREPEKLKSFLYQITTRTCRDFQRRPARREQVADRLRESSSTDADPTERYYVAALLDELDALHTEVVVLRFYEDMDLQTIASVLELPLGTVKSRLYHALRKLRRLVEADAVAEKRGAWCHEQ